MKNKNIVGGLLAVLIILCFMGVLGTLMFRVIPVENKDYFTMGLQALIGFAGLAFGFYLGSSYGSAVKTDQKLDVKSNE